MKRLFFTAVLGICSAVFAQQEALGIQNGVQLVDYHYAPVTDVLYAASTNSYYSSDTSGKVICYDGTTLKFKNVLLEPDGIGIKGMELINGKRLLLHKQYATLDGKSTDSLIGYELDTRQKSASLSFTGGLFHTTSSYTILAPSTDGAQGIAVIKPDPYEMVGSFSTGKAVVSASASGDHSRVAYVQSLYGEMDFVISSIDGTVLFQEPIEEKDYQKKTLVLYEPAGSFLLIEGSMLSRKLKITRYLQDFKKEKVLEIEDVFGQELFMEFTGKSEPLKILVGYGSADIQTFLIGEIKNGEFTFEQLEKEMAARRAFLTEDSGQIVYYKSSMDAYGNPQTRYSWSNKGISQPLDDTQAFGLYRAAFLADGGVVSIGTDDYVEGANLKYFMPGTLQNKYAPLGFIEHIKRYQGLDVREVFLRPDQIDTQDGSVVVQVYQDNTVQMLKYNLATDEHSPLSPLSNKYKEVMSYHGASSQIILANRNMGISPEVDGYGALECCKQGDCKTIEGNYTAAQISKDANLLLTYSVDHKLQIRSLPSLKIISTKVLENKPRVTLFAVAPNEFEIAIDLGYNPNGCYLNHLSIEIKGEEVNYTDRECLAINAVDYSNELPAIALKSLGVAVGEKLIKTDVSMDIIAVSLNPDASKLLVSYKNGQVELFDVASGKKDLTLIQPDYGSHLFVDVDGYYFSNFEVDQLLTSFKDGDLTSLSMIKDLYYKPTALLKKLGEIDQEYAEVLAQAENVRESFVKQGQSLEDVILTNFKLKGKTDLNTNELKNTFSFNSNQQLEKELLIYLNGVQMQEVQFKLIEPTTYEFDLTLADVKNTIEIRSQSGRRLSQLEVNYTGEDLQPSLYVLAVGVSEYQQSKNNLTFAAKDALDMAQLYGNLSFEEVADYQDEYYGNPTFLTDLEGNLIGEKPSFYDDGYGFNDFKTLSADGYFWLGTSYQNAFLYNFKTGKRTKLDYNLFSDHSSVFNNNIIVEENNEGFYYVSGEKRYFFDFDTAQSTAVELPVEEDVLRYNSNVFLLKDKTWVIAEDAFDGTTLNYLFQNGSTNKRDVKIESNSYVNLKTISSDGSHCVILSGDNELSLIDLTSVQPQLIAKTQIKEITSTDTFHLVGDQPVVYQLQDYYDEENQRVTQVISYNKDLSIEKITPINLGISEDIIRVIISENGPLLLNIGDSKAVDQQILTSKIDDIVKNRSATAASFNKTNVRYLLDEKATKRNVLEALRSFKDEVREQDQIIVFIAGHGVLDEELNYYFAPNDMDFDNVKARGIAFDEIIKNLNDTRSTKMLLLMDTCHSGNTLDMANYEVTESRGENGERGSISKRMDKKPNSIAVSDVVSTLFDNFNSVNGVTVLSASSGQDVAYESKELSNGAFTTAYISQLQFNLGKQYFSDPDYTRKVDLSEDFIKSLRDQILDNTNNKQKMDIREINELTKIYIW